TATGSTTSSTPARSWSVRHRSAPDRTTTYAWAGATRSSSCHPSPEVEPRSHPLTCHHAGVSNVAATLLSLALAGLLMLAAYTDVWLVAAVVVAVQVLIALAPAPRETGGVGVPTVVTVAGAGLVASALSMWP